MNEETHLLVGSRCRENQHTTAALSSATRSSCNQPGNKRAASENLKLLASFFGGLLLATLVFAFLGENATTSMSNSNSAAPGSGFRLNFQEEVATAKSSSNLLRESQHHHHSSSHHDSYSILDKNINHNHHDEALISKYTHFQALGFQIYTGGAPVELPGRPGIKNPECYGLNSYGQATELDPDDIARNISNTLWQCYLGHNNPVRDVNQRLQIMKDTVEKAERVADPDPNTLKIFIAPEFFFRGKDGAYRFYNNASDPEKLRRDRHFRAQDGKDFEPDCQEVCHVLKGLEAMVANKKYENWLFLFGTVVVSEHLPQQDQFDYVFYNFAPMLKGYDPDKTDHYGKRFLIPKRYLSQIDFLTPARLFNESMTKELTQGEYYQQSPLTTGSSSNSGGDDGSNDVKFMDPHSESTVVHNPFYEAPQRLFYNQDVWHDYKDELESLGYTMIEYDWVIIDNITMTVEICVDHQAQVALNAYLADNVLSNPTLIPKAVEVPVVPDKDRKRSTSTTTSSSGKVEYVKIPRHLAQLSLVSSSGMTINPNSLALANNGTILLQDGQTDREGTMAWISECDWFSWHFEGGSQHVSRSAVLTNTDISFHYRLHHGWKQYGIWDDLEDLSDTTWKKHIKGVFTTARYEPKLTVYSPQKVAKIAQ